MDKLGPYGSQQYQIQGTKQDLDNDDGLQSTSPSMDFGMSDFLSAVRGQRDAIDGCDQGNDRMPYPQL